MILQFDFSSDIPIYQQIRNQVVIGIAEGKLLPGEHLPTIRALAEESGINMMTVSKAYQMLRDEGYIVTDRRRGAVVIGRRSEDTVSDGFDKTAKAQGDGLGSESEAPEVQPQPTAGQEASLRLALMQLIAAGISKERVLKLCEEILQ